MLVLGVNSYHGDASAAIMENGRIVVCAEEERFTRIKHSAGFPVNAIQFCLKELNVHLSDINYVVVNSDSGKNLFRKARYVVTNIGGYGLLLDKLKKYKKKKNCVEAEDSFFQLVHNNKFKKVEHHVSHLASAYYCSPFAESVLLSVDGFGDFSSTVFGLGEKNNIKIDGRVWFPHSLGLFYQALTQFLGFSNYGDEYKVMGLSSYGEDNFRSQMDEILSFDENGDFKLNLKYFTHHKKKIYFPSEKGEPVFANLFSSQLAGLLGSPRGKEEPITQRHIDLACSVQLMYERVFFKKLNYLYSKYQIDNLSLAGGCAMNSVANGKIYDQTPFKNVFVQPAAGDAGGAVGAAMAVWMDLNPNAKREPMTHAYWGPRFTNEDIRNILDRNELDGICDVTFEADNARIVDLVSGYLIDGMVVGWFQGRMEWGARALGNRSIIADPRRSDMQELLNRKIKRRESFRPFAPSVLREYVGEWFETDADVPFMEKVFKIREEKRILIPAVTHVDGTGRLQTVTKDSNGRYYDLIASFYNKTGVPMILNTSFNENEPIVCKPDEALDCFLRTKMDVLVMENYILKRKS